MARAKRTDRAEARRRYRAYLADVAAQEAEETDLEDEEQPKRASRPEPQPVHVRPGQRLGFFQAMSAARRPVHYLEDLRYTPKLITGSPAIWLPTVLAIVSAGIAIARLNGATLEQARDDVAVQITVGFVLNPYLPMLPALIAGFFAPRATWLAGVLVSFVTTIAYVAVLTIGSNNLAVTGSAVKLTLADAIPYTLSLMLASLPFGALLAAFSGWYKRFLNLTGPAAGMAAQQKSRGKPSRRSPARRPAR